MATIMTTLMGSVADAVADLVAAKSVTNWSTAKKVVGLPGTFRASDCGPIVKAFEAAMPGSSALVVDAGGQFYPNAATKGHVAWLQAQGYEGAQLPTYKEVRVKKVGGSKASSAVAAVLTAVMAGMSPEDKAALILKLIAKE